MLDHLPQSERTFIGRTLDHAWKETNPDREEAQLRALVKHLEVKHLGAAASLLEGLAETLTVTRLGLSSSLLRTFKSTNPVESMISVGRTVARNVKRWRDGRMVLRWTAAGLLEAERQFRRVNGHRDMPILRRALQQHYGCNRLRSLTRLPARQRRGCVKANGAAGPPGSGAKGPFPVTPQHYGCTRLRSLIRANAPRRVLLSGLPTKPRDRFRLHPSITKDLRPPGRSRNNQPRIARSSTKVWDILCSASAGFGTSQVS